MARQTINSLILWKQSKAGHHSLQLCWTALLLGAKGSRYSFDDLTTKYINAFIVFWSDPTAATCLKVSLMSVLIWPDVHILQKSLSSILIFVFFFDLGCLAWCVQALLLIVCVNGVKEKVVVALSISYKDLEWRLNQFYWKPNFYFCNQRYQKLFMFHWCGDAWPQYGC